MKKNQNLVFNKNQNSDLKEIIEINLELNRKDKNLTELSQVIEIQNIKEDAIDICKMCMNEKCIDVNKSLCSLCLSRVKNYRISNIIFLGGGVLGFSIASAGLSIGSLSGFSFGICLAILLQNFYTLFLLFRFSS